MSNEIHNTSGIISKGKRTFDGTFGQNMLCYLPTDLTRLWASGKAEKPVQQSLEKFFPVRRSSIPAEIQEFRIELAYKTGLQPSPVYHKRIIFFPSRNSALIFSICRKEAISLSRSEGFI